MKTFPYIPFLFLALTSCGQKEGRSTEAPSHPQKDTLSETEPKIDRMSEYWNAHPDDGKLSRSKGTVSNGSLENGKLMPHSGPNFRYFDELSYTTGRGFTSDKVRDAVVAAYGQLAEEVPDRHFCIMECSNREGGKIWPHRTHQNGLSVDFMMPKLKDGEPYTGLDSIGGSHYFLTFDEHGRYSKDSTITLDLDLVARHILVLDEHARELGLRIEKVIINTGLKDELYSGEYGRKLKSSGIYVARSLTPLINDLHDDHYHVDFGEL